MGGYEVPVNYIYSGLCAEARELSRRNALIIQYYIEAPDKTIFSGFPPVRVREREESGGRPRTGAGWYPSTASKTGCGVGGLLYVRPEEHLDLSVHVPRVSDS